ncbi:acyl-CoA dehydrogenase family protein [Streptomyces sp. Li-HN-5-11]|uniref:acyl-CoA dehydrogenase family protein n=1 Tax=Streptomyces sp. Li-HN-5-11 TaxID=3075432 RepID=UPI0028A5A3BC|nr:acyl-CoA dehydrogenase family protein [Streptomyces sp. Li-HN-5-11]WNM31912.1 acyl-CoA dehydrogenase family protein [Streptomyces sp. Li-HN-5-11]
MDAAERALLEQTLRKTMTGASGQALDAELAGLGWAEMLAEEPQTAIPLVFRLLGETGAHAPVLNDVILREAERPSGGTLPLPYAGGTWVEWTRDAGSDGRPLDPGLPLRRVTAGDAVPLAEGRRALGWWLLGTGRTMLALAREHVLDRHQFGRPLASFQALRHRLAETYVALEGAEAALTAASDDDTAALLAKAAAGRAALIAARHCQQALGGIGFTAEHALHRHVKRALVLDGLLGSARELTREAGALLLREGRAPRLVEL